MGCVENDLCPYVTDRLVREKRPLSVYSAGRRCGEPLWLSSKALSLIKVFFRIKFTKSVQFGEQFGMYISFVVFYVFVHLMRNDLSSFTSKYLPICYVGELSNHGICSVFKFRESVSNR